MRPEDELQPGLGAALKALNQADRALEAPPEVEARLRSAFRQRGALRHQASPSHRASASDKRGNRVWPAVLAIAAAAVLGIAVRYYRVPRVEPVRVAIDQPRVTPSAATSVGAAPMIQVQDLRHAVNRPKGTPVRNSQTQEFATDFFPLVDFAPPVDDAELVRVSLPASAMREVGLPVREDRMSDRVQADIVMSQGLATAIRFVSYSK